MPKNNDTNKPNNPNETSETKDTILDKEDLKQEENWDEALENQARKKDSDILHIAVEKDKAERDKLKEKNTGKTPNKKL